MLSKYFHKYLTDPGIKDFSLKRLHHKAEFEEAKKYYNDEDSSGDVNWLL